MIKKFINLNKFPLTISGPTGSTKVFRPNEFSYDEYYSRFTGKDRLTIVNVDENKISDTDKSVYIKDKRGMEEREGLRTILMRGRTVTKKLSNMKKKYGVDLEALRRSPKDIPGATGGLVNKDEVSLFAQAKILRAQGKSFTEIAAKLGVTTSAEAPVVEVPVSVIADIPAPTVISTPVESVTPVVTIVEAPVVEVSAPTVVVDKPVEIVAPVVTAAEAPVVESVSSEFAFKMVDGAFKLYQGDKELVSSGSKGGFSRSVKKQYPSLESDLYKFYESVK